MGLHEQRAILARGDPGLLGSLWGAAKGFVTGGPTGAIAGAVEGWRDRPSVATPRSTLPPPGYVPRPGGGTMPLLKVPGVAGTLQRALPGGASGYAVPAGAGACPSGYHLNKSGYYTKQGWVAPRSKCVKNRSRNVSNGRANVRALNRLVAWDKADRKRRTTLKRIAR